MKRIAFPVLLLFLLPALLPAQVNYTLVGKIGELGDPAKVLIRYSSGGNAVTDSALLKDGNFELKGSIAGPVKAMLILYPQGARVGRNADVLTVFLEGGTIRISSPDSLHKATITGSKLNADYLELQAMLKPAAEKNSALMATYATFTPEQRKDKDFMAAFETKYDAIGDERKEVYRKYIAGHPNSQVSLDAIRSAAGSVPAYSDIAPLYASLSADVRNSAEGKLFAEKLAKLKLIEVGSVAPDFTQNDPNGIPVKLSSFKGKYVLVDFWASWCGPCRAENPTVVKTFNVYKDKNFTILSVSLDQPGAKEKWLKAIEDDHLTWTHVSDLAYWKNAVAVLYDVQAIPQNFLVDPNGKIVAKNLRGEALQKKLAELIN